MPSKYPEHEKLAEIKDISQSIGEFLEWLTDHDYDIGHWIYREDLLFPEHEFCLFHGDKQDLLAEFFEIDRDKLEDEKIAMLEEMRKINV